MSGNPEKGLHDEGDHLVGQKEKDRRDHDEDEDHAGGDHGLAPGRPGDPCGLEADFTEIFDRILQGICHSKKWQERRDSNPRPSVLETDALPTELHSYMPLPEIPDSGLDLQHYLTITILRPW